MSSRTTSILAPLSALGFALVIEGCGSDNPAHVENNPSDGSGVCDDSLKSLDLGAGASVTLVRAFKSGDALSLLTATPVDAATASADVCLVKILVGPGNAGPADAPSTSGGIGVEVWLPAALNWNGRYQAVGGGGWQGGPGFTSLTAIGSLEPPGPPPMAVIGAMRGFVTSATDTGHGVVNSGAFAMSPDGTLNQALLEDYAQRSVHEMVLKTKALIAAYYGKPPSYSYWNGCSCGGRQGLMEAQRYPEDFDGLLIAAPAINWDRFQVAKSAIVIVKDHAARAS